VVDLSKRRCSSLRNQLPNIPIIQVVYDIELEPKSETERSMDQASFRENMRNYPGDMGGRTEDLIWFSLGEDRPLVFLAGTLTRWKSVRKAKEGETENDIFAFLTTERNALIGMYHPKAMPVILTTQDEVEHGWRRRRRSRCSSGAR
jgi:hypothetical protein